MEKQAAIGNFTPYNNNIFLILSFSVPVAWNNFELSRNEIVFHDKIQVEIAQMLKEVFRVTAKRKKSYSQTPRKQFSLEFQNFPFKIILNYSFHFKKSIE